MENHNPYYNEFIVTLSIEGTQYEEVEVEVSYPKDTIRHLIQRIIEVFELPCADSYGTPVTYLLGIEYDNEEPTILEFENDAGHEMTLIDYNIQPGDHLHLIQTALAGGYTVFTTIAISNKSLYINDILDEEMWRYGYKFSNRSGFLGRMYEKSKLIKESIKENKQEQEFDKAIYDDYQRNGRKNGRYYCVRQILLSKLPPERLYDGLGGFRDPMFLDQWHGKWYGKRGRRLCDYETEECNDVIQYYYLYTSHPNTGFEKDTFLKRMKYNELLRFSKKN